MLQRGEGGTLNVIELPTMEDDIDLPILDQHRKLNADEFQIAAERTRTWMHSSCLALAML